MRIDVSTLKQFGNPDVLGCADCGVLDALEAEVPLESKMPNQGQVVAVKTAMNKECVADCRRIGSCIAVRAHDAMSERRFGPQYGLGKAAKQHEANAAKRSVAVRVGVPT